MDECITLFHVFKEDSTEKRAVQDKSIDDNKFSIQVQVKAGQ